MRFIKKTKSICPICFFEIDSDIFEDKNQVYMLKKCPTHGKFEVLLEKDYSVYSKLMNKKPLKESRKSLSLMIPITHKCNLNCKICYFPYNSSEDLKLEEIKKLIKKFDASTIRISGGEPTLRKDLPDIIKYINSMGKSHSLLTNGITLANKKFVKKLINSGLKRVHLSFNSLKNDNFLRIDGKQILQKKLKAFENLKENGIKIILSTLLVRGVNETELRDILNFYLKNHKAISQWNIRSGVQIGRHADILPYTISELTDLVCSFINIKKEDLLKNYSKKKNFISSPCSLQIGLFYHRYPRGDKLILTEVNQTDLEKLNYLKFKKFYLGYKILKQRGIITSLRYFIEILKNKREVICCNIKLRSWPSKYTLDLDEISYCPSKNLCEDGRIRPFCYGLIFNEKLKKNNSYDENKTVISSYQH